MPLNVNHLRGRVLLAPATSTKSREILVVYEQLASLERWENLITELRRYGRVTMPDLPGFGGMDSFYKLNQQASIDNLAGYLAAFIKLRYKRKTITIFGVGFGFVVVTRMLQLHPDLVKKVNLLIAADSYAHHDDLGSAGPRNWIHVVCKRLGAHKLPAIFYRNVFLYPAVLKQAAHSAVRVGNGRYETDELEKDTLRETAKVYAKLWRVNDVRTYMQTTQELLRLDNCTKTIKLPLVHMVGSQSKLDAFRTEQHLSVVFTKVQQIDSDIEQYATIGILPTPKTSALLPRKIRSMLLKA